MSTLQISLAIFGGLVLAGVVGYNAWITSRSAPRTAREKPAPRELQEPVMTHDTDPLATDTAPKQDRERIEPVLGNALPARSVQARDIPVAERQATEPLAQIAVQAGSAATRGVPPVTLQHVVAASDKRLGLDALIDVITPLIVEGPVSGDAVLAALPGTRRVGSKPFAVECQTDPQSEWEPPRAGQRYLGLQAGLQLANRAGAMNDIEFSEFVIKAQAFADAVGAALEFPDMRAEVARARELDAFASGHDAQLGFTLRARRAAWSPGYVTQHAAKLGFVAGVLPGRMVLASTQTGHAPILSLSFDPQAAMAEDPEQTALREVSLSLEVTHVPRNEQPFVRLRQAASALAEAMDGEITDDAGQALSTETMDGIGGDLEGLYDALDRHDLSAGSPQARRLFS